MDQFALLLSECGPLYQFGDWLPSPTFPFAVTAHLIYWHTSIPRFPVAQKIWRGGASIDRSEFEKVFHEREDGAVDP